MQRKDILELRKQFTKKECTITNLTGCYVNGEKQVVSKFSEFFLNLDEDELFKYLEIAKKVLSGTNGNNILKLNFPLDDNFENERQIALTQLKNSGLKDEDLLDDFYKLIIDHYDYDENYLILLFHDAYDVMIKTTDNQSLDDSDEVYEYILCAICPVSLSKPGLTYCEPEDIIKSRIRDWVVEPPLNGFVYPAFVDRSSDVNSLIYYTKKPKEPHPELMEDILGCNTKQTITIQKETFESVVKFSLGVEDEQADLIFMDVQDNLNTMVDEYNALYDDTDFDPITLSKNHIQELLTDSGIPEEASEKIEASYSEWFGDELPLAASLIDKKILKASAQVQKERNLIKQIGVLQTKLEEVTSSIPATDESLDEDEIVPDISLQVKADKLAEVKTEVIDGQKYILIPYNEDEKFRVNGSDDLI